MGSFEIRRTATIDADPALVHRFLNDFHEWQAWSPWEGLDAQLERTYSGATSGVGAHYAWSGNRKAGRGSMEIVGSTPEEVAITLTFEKPFKAVNDLRFTLTPSAGGTEVEWRMTGTQKGAMAIFGKLISVDKLVGKDFDRGLAQLKATAEA